MDIRQLTETDLEQCAQLYVDTFNSEPWYNEWTYETAYKRLSDIFHTPGFFGVVYIEDDMVQGAVVGHIEQWFDGKMYNLKEMFVHEDSRGQGIGSGIIGKIDGMLMDLGVHFICLMTSKGEMTEEFYKKNGYSTMDNMVLMLKDIESPEM